MLSEIKKKRSLKIKSLILLSVVVLFSFGQVFAQDWSFLIFTDTRVDSANTYFNSADASFHNDGWSAVFVEGISPIFTINWTKKIENQFLPDTLRLHINLLSVPSWDSLEIYLAVQDSVGNFCPIGGKIVFFPDSRKEISLSISTKNVPIKEINRLYFIFQFRTNVPARTGGVIQLLDMNIKGAITGIERPTFASVKGFGLDQNYPNPFNPTTTISYSIPKTSFVTLKVYSVLGEEVANLVNEERNAGKYRTEFDAGNLPSGIYFYRLQAGGFVETKKMILIK